ncbi:NAD-dependent histone deacetylase SIR2 [Ceratobasidium sp. AG-Ba]|nr:NAD-dependent histone deacetylase SIR2 [Ceratobasidium sp. AG-Ba]
MPSTTPFTSVVPLDNGTGSIQMPACARVEENSSGKLREVYSAINDARRVVVLCGAGISVHAGIPDFRSSTGLFQSLKREHPKENITSGRDLFDSAVFKSEETMALFYKMISHLAVLSETAEPTPFHFMLQQLDSRGQLLRVYTQNIDALEERAGLSFGIPIFPARTRKRKVATPSTPARARSSSSPSPATTPPRELSDHRSATSSALTSPRRTPIPTPQLPRCIPLHGTLQNLYCPSCHLTLPLHTPEHLEALGFGNPLACPQCAELDGTRRLVGKRTRGITRLRPSVVLYNEPHREGEAERVGECVRRDLMGLGSGQLSRTGSTRKKRREDILIVAGTSLRIPGAKRIVREFAKALHLHANADSTNHAQDQTPAPAAVKTVYLNLDFPVPAREWDGVFDVWVQGDVQTFALGFKDYQAELNQDFPATGASTPTGTAMHNNGTPRTKSTRKPIDAAQRRKRGSGDLDIDCSTLTSIKKSKRKASPSPQCLSIVEPSAAYQAETFPSIRSSSTSPTENNERSNSRLVIKIKRPQIRAQAAAAVPDNISTRARQQSSQETHDTTSDTGYLVSSPVTAVDHQRAGRGSMLPTMMKIAT